MNEQFEQIVKLMESKLSHLMLPLDEDPVLYGPIAINITMESFSIMRSAFLKQTQSAEVEIRVFKQWKPKVTSKLIYFNERLKMELNRTQTSQKMIKKYYRSQLKKLEKFTMENASFVKYYLNDHQYLDHYYFLRNQEDYQLDLDSSSFQHDKLFSTSHDFIAAKILANMQLESDINEKLQILNKKRRTYDMNRLKWTGSKVGMVELIYALHSMGVFNHGTSDIKEITKVFSGAFGIEVEQIHRIFHEISNRKSDRTKFLNGLKEGLLNRMEQSDGCRY